MDWFDGSSAPPEYQEVAWIADLCQLAQGLGWAINYSCTVYQSFRDGTYGMSILPLCCNFAWEFVYTFVYPSQNLAEKVVVSTYMILNLLIMYSAIKFSPSEWSHAAFVQKSIPVIFLVGIAGFISGHIALAETVGPGRAANFGAFFCLEMLCVGAWCQLISRGSTRGTSYTIWLSRFLGSYVGIVPVVLRATYWPQAFGWLMSPMAKWHMAICFSLDVTYFIFLRHVRRTEQQDKDRMGSTNKSR